MARWAEKLQVSTSGYYAWLYGKPEREKREEEEKKLIKEIFEESKRTYGLDTICAVIRKRGGHMGRVNAPVTWLIWGFPRFITRSVARV